MVAFRLGQQRDPHDESERTTEVFERQLAGQVAAPVERPAWDRATKPFDLCLWERWSSRRVFAAVVVEKLVDNLGNGRTVLIDR
jgi:hypothetical protein